jgi:hypothetical protein
MTSLTAKVAQSPDAARNGTKRPMRVAWKGSEGEAWTSSPGLSVLSATDSDNGFTSALPSPINGLRCEPSIDFVVVDLPSLSPVPDFAEVGDTLDGFVLVVEWGQTAQALVEELIDENQILFKKCLGVLLSKVDLSKLKMFAAAGSREAYYIGLHAARVKANSRSAGPKWAVQFRLLGESARTYDATNQRGSTE